MKDIVFAPAHLSGRENIEQAKVLRILMILAFLAIVAALFWNSAVIEGLNPKADAYKEQAIAEADAKTVAPGDIYDCMGRPIVVTTQAGEASVYADDFAYTQVLGYTTNKVTYYDNGVFTESQNDYRLMDYYGDLLYTTSDVDSTKGTSLVLTLDNDLQMQVANLLKSEMSLLSRGSAVVLDAKTGEILSMVSYPTFNANDLNSSFMELQNVSEEQEIYYPITHKGYEVPGSIFKIVTAVALLDNGYEDLTVIDQDSTVQGVKVVNAYSSPGDSITYYEALERSSNVYFATAGLKLGGKKLEETAKKFLIGENLELDFGTVKSNWDLTVTDKAEVAATAYGQGNTLLSTIYAAMITQTIANDGVMMEPHILLTAQDEHGTILKRGETKVLSEVTSKDTADKITEAMLAATDSHLNVVEGDENRQIFEKYEIASKTGTGETGEDDLHNAWFISFAPADDPQYVVVVNQCDTEKYGQDLMDTAAGIYRYLFEEQ